MTSKPSIRRAEETDAEALSRIGISTFTETFGHLYSSADLNAFLTESHSPEFYAAFLNDETCATWIAEGAQGEAAGYCTCGPCGLPAPEMPANAGELHRLYVQKTQQGSGLGRAFLDIAIDWLEAHFAALYVGVWAQNTGAQRLYRAYGFEKIAEYIFMVGEHPDPEWIMKRASI